MTPSGVRVALDVVRALGQLAACVSRVRAALGLHQSRHRGLGDVRRMAHYEREAQEVARDSAVARPVGTGADSFSSRSTSSTRARAVQPELPFSEGSRTHALRSRPRSRHCATTSSRAFPTLTSFADAFIPIHAAASVTFPQACIRSRSSSVGTANEKPFPILFAALARPVALPALGGLRWFITCRKSGAVARSKTAKIGETEDHRELEERRARAAALLVNSAMAQPPP